MQQILYFPFEEDCVAIVCSLIDFSTSDNVGWSKGPCYLKCSLNSVSVSILNANLCLFFTLTTSLFFISMSLNFSFLVRDYTFVLIYLPFSLPVRDVSYDYSCTHKSLNSGSHTCLSCQQIQKKKKTSRKEPRNQIFTCTHM